MISGNKLICDCKLAWIWGLRNETKNKKLRDALEGLTCFLESHNTTLKINNEDLEWNEALEIARNQGEFLPFHPPPNLTRTPPLSYSFYYEILRLESLMLSSFRIPYSKEAGLRSSSAFSSLELKEWSTEELARFASFIPLKE